MNDYPDETTRRPADLAFFGLVFAGLLVGAAGVELRSVAISIFGIILLGLGMGYFLVAPE
jgi:hypothetical protein